MFNYKILNPLTVVFAGLLYSSLALAGEPQGCYEVDGGKLSASISAPGILSLNLNISPAIIKELGITNSFSKDAETGNNIFSLSLPIIGLINLDLPTVFNGTWAMSKDPKFTVDITDLPALAARLQSYGATTQVTQSFTGKVLDDGAKISGKFVLGIKAKIMRINASAKVNNTFTATRISEEPCVQEAPEEQSSLLNALKSNISAKNAASSSAQVVADFIMNVFKSIF